MRMKLWGISDLHVHYRDNLEALRGLRSRPGDWLLAPGDLADRDDHFREVLSILCERFARVVWTPGNHELWSHPKTGVTTRGEARYRQLVEICREFGVVTPEDEYPVFPGEGGPVRIVPTFLLYDYSFAPDEVGEEGALAWAAEHGLVCNDEHHLYPEPYPSKAAWCRERLRVTEARLAACDTSVPMVLVNHFPLRRDLVRLGRIPRFTIWCGTRATEDWHRRFPVKVVVSGHLHVRATDWKDGVRFEEVALGYPRHWLKEQGIEHYLREILPGPAVPPGGEAPVRFHR